MSLIIIFQNDFSFVCMCIYDTSVRVYMTAELHIWKSQDRFMGQFSPSIFTRFPSIKVNSAGFVH